MYTMGSIAMRGKNIVGSPHETIMPPDAAFQVIEGPVPNQPSQELEVSSVYSANPEVMDRK